MSVSGEGREEFVEYVLRTLSDAPLVGQVLQGDRTGLPLQLTYLTFVFETDANNTESSSQQPRTPSAQVYKYHFETTALSSYHPLTRDTEVLLFGLKSNTQYKATVYSQAADGTEGQPQNVTFRTGTLNFVECLQPEFSHTKFGPP